MATSGQDPRTGQSGKSGVTTPTSGISPSTTNAAMTGSTPGVSTNPGSSTTGTSSTKTGMGVGANPTTPYDAETTSGISSGDMARASTSGSGMAGSNGSSTTSSTTDREYHARQSELKEELRHTGDTIKQEARRTAQALKEEARETVRQMADQQKQNAAGELGGLAQALRRAADEMEGQSHLPVDRYVRSAADGLERLSESLRRRDVDSLIGRLERYTREQPAMVLGGALAIGFLVARMMRGSSQATTETTRPELYH